MNWTEVKISTNKEGIEPITGLLLNLGINGIQIENPEDFNEFLEGTQTYWDYVDESLMHLKEGETRVILYIPDIFVRLQVLLFHVVYAYLQEVHLSDSDISVL